MIIFYAVIGSLLLLVVVDAGAGVGGSKGGRWEKVGWTERNSATFHGHFQRSTGVRRVGIIRQLNEFRGEFSSYASKHLIFI